MIPNAWAGFDFGLGSEVDMLRKSVSDFAQDRIAPRADAIDRDNEFPRDLWPEMGALGLHGITVPEEFGGAGLGYLAHCVAMEEVSRASASVGLSYGAHSNLCVNQLNRNGTAEQKRKYLPQLADGSIIGCFARSSATTSEAGSFELVHAASKKSCAVSLVMASFPKQKSRRLVIDAKPRCDRHRRRARGAGRQTNEEAATATAMSRFGGFSAIGGDPRCYERRRNRDQSRFAHEPARSLIRLLLKIVDGKTIMLLLYVQWKQLL